MAASLQRLAISAPLNPGDKEANLFAYSYFVYLEESLRGFKCTKNISYLPFKSGKPTSTYRSKRPGLVNAESRTYLRLVAPMTTILLLV